MHNKDLKLLISSCSTDNIVNSIKLAQRLGAGIEVCDFVDPYILENSFEQKLKEFKEAFSSFNGTLTIHAPFYDLNPIAMDPGVKVFTLKRYEQIIIAAQELKVSALIFHTAYNSQVRLGFYDNYFVEKQSEFWQEYIKNFDDIGIKVFLENTYEAEPDILNRIIDNVANNYLKICIDVGHVNVYSNLRISQWIEKCADRVEYMHYHNNCSKFDSHQSLAKGTIDFAKISDCFSKHGLEPQISLEIFDEPSIVESVDLLRSLNCLRAYYRLGTRGWNSTTSLVGCAVASTSQALTRSYASLSEIN